MGKLVERNVSEPLLCAVAESRQAGVDLRERRLNRDEAVAEICDVPLLVGVQEVVQGGDQTHRVPELRQVGVASELREACQGPGFHAEGRESQRESDPA